MGHASAAFWNHGCPPLHHGRSMAHGSLVDDGVPLGQPLASLRQRRLVIGRHDHCPTWEAQLLPNDKNYSLAHSLDFSVLRFSANQIIDDLANTDHWTTRTESERRRIESPVHPFGLGRRIR